MSYDLFRSTPPPSASGCKQQDARSSVRERLRNEGVDVKLGAVNRLISVADAVEAYQI